jgi:UDP-N-acetylglucosamine acyltransferase
VHAAGGGAARGARARVGRLTVARIHPSAAVDPRAELADDVEVGAFAVVGPDVRIDAGTRLWPHAIVEGPTTIGRDNRIHPHAVIGGAPQDKKYRGEPTRLEIGHGNVFRECVTVNRGTVQDAGVTRIGDDNWVMAYVHIAHDCVVGSHTIFANTTNLGGHVAIGDWAILGGCTQVHQFCKVGAHAMTGTGTVVLHDIPPFVMASGNTASAHGLNAEGLRRRGFEPDTIALLRRAYKTLYRAELTLQQAREALAGMLADVVAAVPEQPAPAEGAALTAADALRLLTDFLGRVERGIVR